MNTLLPYLDKYPNIGKLFSTKRLALDASLDDVCTRLDVSRFYIIGLESNRIDLLPTVSETRHLITCYSQLLGLDCQLILTQFDTWLETCPAPEPTPIDDMTPATPYGGLKAAVVAGLFLLYPVSTTHLQDNNKLTISNTVEAESNIATLEFADISTTSESKAATLIKNSTDTPILDFAPKPYSDTRNADDIKRDRLFYLQEQIRLGVEPVAMPYRG